MVFMEDSERAAEVAVANGIDAGLHLNFTTPFTDARVPAQLLEHQQRVLQHLRRHRLAPAIFHPGLAPSFDYVTKAQLDEFGRLFGAAPSRFDGHHHMHLCANVIVMKLLPAGTIIRRNFSFRRGEKSVCNRLYRTALDKILARRHRLADFLFALPPMQPVQRLERICGLARGSVVELEVHPVLSDEYKFLIGGTLSRWADGLTVGSLSEALGRAE